MGKFSFFLIFIVLLLFDSYKLVFRYLDKVAFGASIELLAVIFLLSKLVTQLLSRIPLPQGLSVEVFKTLTGFRMGILETVLKDLQIFAWSLFAGGIILYLIAFYVGRIKKKSILSSVTL